MKWAIFKYVHGLFIVGWLVYYIKSHDSNLNYDYLMNTHVTIQYSMSAVNLLFMGWLTILSIAKKDQSVLLIIALMVGIIVQAIMLMDLIGINQI